MLPKLRGGQRVVTGNAPNFPSQYEPTHNFATGAALAGTGLANHKPKPAKDLTSVNTDSGTPLAGTTIDSVTVGTSPSQIRNRLPNIAPKFGTHRAASMSWLVVLTVLGSMAGIYAVYQNRS